MRAASDLRIYVRLTHGLIDEVSIYLIPGLFGDLDSEHISLEILDVPQPAEVIHTRFRVVK